MTTPRVPQSSSPTYTTRLYSPPSTLHSPSSMVQTVTLNTSQTPTSSISTYDQRRALDMSLNSIKAQGYHMRAALETGKIMDALKHCSTLLSELRTGVLHPKAYYEIFMAVSDELQYLQDYLVEEHNKGRNIREFYELVQYAGCIVPRIYLLITVGSVFIQTKEASAMEILKDLTEMCKGVQHPLRGLFLRYYLLQSTKDKLADATNARYNGNLEESVHFILGNFGDMNKLWVRMQHQGSIKDKEKVEEERQELKLLVGANLVRLSHLEGIDLNLYVKTILPEIVNQILNCRDAIAQEYLIESIIQVFPDNLHLQTFSDILDIFGHLEKAVNLKNILSSLLNRLALLADKEKGAESKDMPPFSVFFDKTKDIIQHRTFMSLEDSLTILNSLVDFSLILYPNNLSNLDKILQFCCEFLRLAKLESIDVSDPRAGQQLLRLLKLPIEQYADINSILSLEHYSECLAYLSISLQKNLSIAIAENIIQNATMFHDCLQIQRVFKVLSSLLQPSIGANTVAGEEMVIPKLILLFCGNDADEELEINKLLYRELSKSPDRLSIFMPALIFKLLRFCKALKENDSETLAHKKWQQAFQICHQSIANLSKAGFNYLAIRLYLTAAEYAGSCEFEIIAYEFMTQAFTIYEEEISDSKLQQSLLSLMIGSIQEITIFTHENFDTLSTKCQMYASKLLKKPDQCKFTGLCAHLFWNAATSQEQDTYRRNGIKVMDCLQKCFKIADSCLDIEVKTYLLVDLLDRSLFFYEQKADTVTGTYITSIIDMIKCNIDVIEDTNEAKKTKKYYSSIVHHILQLKSEYIFQDIIVEAMPLPL